MYNEIIDALMVSRLTSQQKRSYRGMLRAASKSGRWEALLGLERVGLVFQFKEFNTKVLEPGLEVTVKYTHWRVSNFY